MIGTFSAILGILLFFILSSQRASLKVWTLSFFLYLGLWTAFAVPDYGLAAMVWGIYFLFTLLLNVSILRQLIVSTPALAIYQKAKPNISQTERDAIEAGTIDFDAELFSGKPNWYSLLYRNPSKFSAEEQAFLEGPVKELCAMIDDWDICHHSYDLSKAVWAFLKEKGFFALIIPKQYGGLAFSAYAHSEILARVAGRSISVASTIAVPNSLGPAELLLRYGSEEQKDFYLPRLASGQEVPCFALTGPLAGSDATAMPDSGVVCKEQYKGKETIGIRLNWDKRYITLAPVATVLGLAFKLSDPENLLSDEVERGITLALIPVWTSGVSIGKRHYPLNIPFQNGPTQGNNVFIPIDWVIGGKECIGNGWRMLMECLAEGRGISLPANALGGARAAVVSTGAYVRIREQFNVSIAKFEGIQMPLARMVGLTYIMQASRDMTTAIIDQGGKPSVIDSIVKYHCTEMGRQIANDAMDIHGGKGICLGPRNYLARGYQAVPISITVEGANILTRSMMIFGQGAMRCHPYILKLHFAAELTDSQQAKHEFDKHLIAYLGYIGSNKVRSFLFGITHGYLSSAPRGPYRRYYQHLNRFSANLAFLADFAIIYLGKNIKRREALSGRLADLLSYLYLASTVLKSAHDNHHHESAKPIIDWACQYCFFQLQQAMDEFLQNFPYRFLAVAARMLVMPLGRRYSYPSDKLQQKVADCVSEDSAYRKELTETVDLDPSEHNPFAIVEQTFQQLLQCEDALMCLKAAVKENKLKAESLVAQIDEAVKLSILTVDEAKQLRAYPNMHDQVIAVDAFDKI